MSSENNTKIDNVKKEIIAAIDIGTNSFHMVIVEINDDGMITVISRTKEMVRLGEGGDEMKYLTVEAIDRGINAIKHFVKFASMYNPKFRAIATSAVREATNGEEFINKARQETGIEIEVVSGTEEGRLTYLGVMHGVPIFDKRTLVADIGGGSTETIIGYKGEILYSNSEKLGAIRLTQRFFKNEITQGKINECRQYVAGKFAPIFSAMYSVNFNEIVCTAGTFETIVRMATLKKNKEIYESPNGIVVSANSMLEAIDSIVEAGSPQAISKLEGMETKRADIMLAGAIIAEYIIKNCQIKKIMFSPYALREGILYDTAQKYGIKDKFSQLSELRKNTICNIAKKFNTDIEHSKKVTEFALDILEALKLPDFNEYEKEMLEYAAILHDVGYFISHDLHHKHTLYLIENSDLPGFTNNEAKLIANIARYHRKSHPKKAHQEYAVLPDKGRYTVKVLSGILRIAEGLDRRHKQYVKKLIVEFNEKTNVLQIKLVPIDEKIIPDIEIWGAERRTMLLEEILKIKIEISCISDNN